MMSNIIANFLKSSKAHFVLVVGSCKHQGSVKKRSKPLVTRRRG